METLLDTGKSTLVKYDNFGPDMYQQIKNLPLIVEPPIYIMGRECHQRRDIGFFSDDSIGYRYSGQIAESIPLSDYKFLKDFIVEVNNTLDTNFNGILINRYVNGEKYIGAHSDDERGLSNSMVASIAYGPGIRTFRIRDKKNKNIVLDYEHTPRTLLIMGGNFQKEFTHEIPVQKRITKERISLTFRFHSE